MTDRLTHLDEQGRAHMVDIGEKLVTHRVCVARCEVHMAPETLARITEGRVAKGDVLATARIAGIQAAKRAAEWIPLAHPLPLDAVRIELSPEGPRSGGEGSQEPAVAVLRIEACVETHWRTGVEMEALVAASAAGLTVYDMCKAVDRGMTLESVRLVEKRGGKSGTWKRPGESR
jgi:cyclic pyranopterin phosphate synthase